MQHFKPHSLLQRQLNLSHSPSQHAIKFCFKGGEKRGEKSIKKQLKNWNSFCVELYIQQRKSIIEEAADLPDNLYSCLYI